MRAKEDQASDNAKMCFLRFEAWIGQNVNRQYRSHHVSKHIHEEIPQLEIIFLHLFDADFSWSTPKDLPNQDGKTTTNG